MKRLDHWPGLLETFIASRRDIRFIWGWNDCCLFACDGALIMTGEDLARGFRGSYHTGRGAMTAINEFGASSVGELADIIAAKHDLRCLPPSFAQRGDIVLLNREHGESLGIVSLDGLEVWAPGDECLAILPLTQARRAWRI